MLWWGLPSLSLVFCLILIGLKIFSEIAEGVCASVCVCQQQVEIKPSTDPADTLNMDIILLKQVALLKSKYWHGQKLGKCFGIGACL